MPLSLKIPPEKEACIRKAAHKAGKSKSASIIDALDEKLGLAKGREQVIRELAGWLPHEEAERMRRASEGLREFDERDWS
ncbi:MAG: hypothetical protein JXL84_14650 [Deltaproteobacteria bacterium]|nr:hypothetical protein [Deltaproteobacteria bacterium]